MFSRFAAQLTSMKASLVGVVACSLALSLSGNAFAVVPAAAATEVVATQDQLVNFEQMAKVEREVKLKKLREYLSANGGGSLAAKSVKTPQGR